MNSSPLPEPPADPLLEAGNRLTSMIARRPEVLEYAGRCLVEGEAMGSVIFDGLLRVSILQRDEFTKKQLNRRGLDPEWAALNPLILRIGAIILRPHIERFLGKPFTTPTQLQRWDAAVTTLIREGQLRRDPALPRPDADSDD